MAHGCKATQEDPELKRKLTLLKEWVIERNLYEAKQAQQAFRANMSEKGKIFLRSSTALRLIVKSLIPFAQSNITTKVRDNLSGMDSFPLLPRLDADSCSKHGRHR